MVPSRTSVTRSDMERARAYAQEKLAEQFRNLLLEVEAMTRQTETQIGELEARGARYASSVPRLKQLRNSLAAFHLFAFHYFAYIQEGNPNNLGNQRLALEKIQNEIVPLRPLLEQRRAPGRAEQEDGPSRLDYLQLADKIALDFLDKCGLLASKAFYNRRSPQEKERKRKLPGILVYFEEMPLIRQGYDAYDRVPSISLPTSTWCNPWQWLSLAHEMGHYVYENLDPPVPTTADPRKNQLSITLQERVKGMLAEKGASKAVQEMWAGWSEELFADLYGALILGPAYTEAYICQWLLPKLAGGGHLLEHDGVHPPDLLRPFVQLELLRQQIGNSETEKRLAHEIERIETLWCNACAGLVPAKHQERYAGDLFAFWLQQRIGGARVGVRRCLKYAGSIAEILFQMLKEYKGQHIQYYDGDTHEAVQALAHFLAKDNTHRPAGAEGRLDLQLQKVVERSPTTLLAVAWYAWTKLPKSAPLLSAPPEAVEELRDWIRTAVEELWDRNQSAYPPAEPPATEGDVPLHRVDDLLGMQPGARPDSPAFLELCAELYEAMKQEGESADRDNLCVALLEVEFSVLHTHEGESCGTNGFYKCIEVPLSPR